MGEMIAYAFLNFRLTKCSQCQILRGFDGFGRMDLLGGWLLLVAFTPLCASAHIYSGDFLTWGSVQ